jgi:hypothetical protein
VGPVARAEDPGTATEGPPIAQDSIVTAAAHAARISQLQKSFLTPSHEIFPVFSMSWSAA